MKREKSADIVIIGGSMGGCAAALSACKMGYTVIMTEETKWIGGQLTSQAVPPDEHRWIEQFGCTQSYRTFRNKVREHYINNYAVKPEHRHLLFNPGNSLVSRISHEPRVALHVLEEMLAPFVHNGLLTVLTEHKITSVETEGDYLKAATVIHEPTQQEFTLQGTYFLDATECGDVLPLANVPYVTGAESQSQTDEPHAVTGDPEPLNMQAITHCFAVDYREGEDHTIEKPGSYSFWRDYQPDVWPDRLLSWTAPQPVSLKPITYSLMPNGNQFSLFQYRRLIDSSQFDNNEFPHDISLINWPQNDYLLGPVFDIEEKERERHLKQAKELSLSLLYWMQTEAPRPDGGQGYPGLKLRPDVVGTEDGLAMYPYIRESRRIQAEFTVLEQHLSAEIRGDKGAVNYEDSVGIGCYRIDLHPSTGGDNYIDISSLPFQIPLGSMISVKFQNLIPACKNIGTTHITNGCYRLHPVEWNLGEVAGYLAGYAMKKSTIPRHVRNHDPLLKDFQKMLTQQGIELQWPVIHAV
ncbi:FAD-dependent oxidoreductase [Fictibacillus phosphorivorans]|uniref:FAD-dependent oxidoreductase n=1 Tax=Fictibacillus phosphorivorans TaxID=1221500 RepID=UPI00203F4236|nr:FAD-dependent oxidoreductase [Fictibacillus phosphorivorans]MCM3718542.1 FAD-dependent oxidoreductase [Fictibacillus phosphorivorans]MCM3776102.1 FAD-dependent oxidoreductase [Fictibacillus phosphorivorans]